ncbi:hypothetical protein [Streptomyces enissocaesilis]|uniref:Uncharacterized protein n=1 Tax=Streptomyces enissocaesilis TaxID=332589 RepID=A0ABP6J4X7_9ACTN
MYGIAEHSCVNFLPVEDAARVMAEAVRRCPGEGLSTYHVVHAQDVPVREVMAALSAYAGVPLRPLPGASPPVPAAERTLHESMSGLLCWLEVSRRYDTAGLTALGLSRNEPPFVDGDFMLSTLDTAGRHTSC